MTLNLSTIRRQSYRICSYAAFCGCSEASEVNSQSKKALYDSSALQEAGQL
ncbi:hypothetical protein CBL_03033 [Carabus blaptoides fortunei]